MAKTGKPFNPSRLRVLPEPASDRSDPKHTVDDLFQRLVHVLGMKPEDARLEIRDRLLRGAPLIALQVESGVTDSNSVTTPPEGVILSINPQSWEQMLLLRIREGKLVIEPGGNMIYPWNACSFAIANWSLVEELWPNPNRAGPASAPEDSHAAMDEESVTRPVKQWIKYAIEQRPDQFIGLGPEPAGKLLHKWMKAGNFHPERIVGWSRIKNILTEDSELRRYLKLRKSTRKSKTAREAPGNRPRKAK